MLRTARRARRSKAEGADKGVRSYGAEPEHKAFLTQPEDKRAFLCAWP